MAKRMLRFILLICILAVLGSAHVLAAEPSEFTYQIVDDTYCVVTGYTGTDTTVVIPSEIEVTSCFNLMRY